MILADWPWRETTGNQDLVDQGQGWVVLLRIQTLLDASVSCPLG